MSEADQRSKMVKGMRVLHAVPIENRVGIGTPDVNYLDGWIECKWVRRWPVREETIVEIDHFTKEQKLWLRERWRRGGVTGLVLSSGKQWFYFLGPTAARFVGSSNLALLLEVATAYWPSGFNGKELVQCLRCIQKQRENISLSGDDDKVYRWNRQRDSLDCHVIKSSQLKKIKAVGPI